MKKVDTVPELITYEEFLERTLDEMEATRVLLALAELFGCELEDNDWLNE